MEFKDFKIGQYFWCDDRVFKVIAIVNAIGAIEAMGNDGVIYFFDWLQFKHCTAVNLDASGSLS